MNTFLFYLILIPLVIFAISQILCITAQLLKNQKLEFYGRSLASFLALVLCATYGTIASACLNVVGYGGLGQWTTARAFKWTMLWFTGVWFEIDEQGKQILDGTRPAVFMGNHQTELDVLMLGHIFPLLSTGGRAMGLIGEGDVGMRSSISCRHAYIVCTHDLRRGEGTVVPRAREVVGEGDGKGCDNGPVVAW